MCGSVARDRQARGKRRGNQLGRAAAGLVLLPPRAALRLVLCLRVGLVDNSKHNSDQLLMRIAGLLEREHGAKAHVMRRKRSAGVPPSPEIVEEFKAACDVVVAGVGD